MANRLQSVAILSLLITLGVGVIAQSPQATPQDANPKAGTSSKPTEEKITSPQRAANLQGFGAVGQIPKFGGGDFLINSVIFESSTGKIGVGTQAPGSTLSVNGQIETLSGGVKFPDGSVQTTAGVSPMDALMAVAHDETLTGAGTPNSPLRVASFVGQPFVASGSGTTTAALIDVLLTTVPAGKLLVIEQVTASCVLGAGERLLTLELRIAPYNHYLVSSFNGGNGVIDFFASSQHVRLYAAAGMSVHLSARRNNITDAVAVCLATLTGSLIDQPGAN